MSARSLSSAPSSSSSVININGNPVAAAYAKQEQIEALEQRIDHLFPRCPPGAVPSSSLSGGKKGKKKSKSRVKIVDNIIDLRSPNGTNDDVNRQNYLYHLNNRNSKQLLNPTSVNHPNNNAATTAGVVSNASYIDNNKVESPPPNPDNMMSPGSSSTTSSGAGTSSMASSSTNTGSDQVVNAKKIRKNLTELSSNACAAADAVAAAQAMQQQQHSKPLKDTKIEIAGKSLLSF